VRAEDFPKAQKPACKVWADFGDTIGIKKSSAQITGIYNKESLIGKQIIGVVNFPPKQIADFMSEFLLTGFYDADGNIVLAIPECKVPLGEKLS
jgi:tRNA-binding protein